MWTQLHASTVSAALSSGGGLTHLTAGYSLVTWLVVANLGFTGLLVSWVMKFADSIMKVGSHSEMPADPLHCLHNSANKLD